MKYFISPTGTKANTSTDLHVAGPRSLSTHDVRDISFFGGNLSHVRKEMNLWPGARTVETICRIAIGEVYSLISMVVGWTIPQKDSSH